MFEDVSEFVCLDAGSGRYSCALMSNTYTRVGWQVNHLDIAPRYAGVLVGITMTAGMLAGVTNPLIISVLVEEQVCQLHTSRVAFAGIVLNVLLFNRVAAKDIS